MSAKVDRLIEDIEKVKAKIERERAKLARVEKEERSRALDPYICPPSEDTRREGLRFQSRIRKHLRNFPLRQTPFRGGIGP